EAPYEEAKTRVALASAYRSGGDPEGAVLELQAARAAFGRLGATIDEQVASRLLVELGVAGGADEATSSQATRTFVFTDIVKSTELVEAMGDDAWNEVLRWHDQMLQRLIGEDGGEEIKHVGDGLFASFDRPEQAITCAVQIQRTLSEHRRNHGFAPQVRIGLHRAAASRGGLDYRGMGVPEAARIARVVAGVQCLACRYTVQPG